MPSGAKRRKAAKKRKEKEQNDVVQSSKTEIGSNDDDPRSQDDKGSDSGDATSPTVSSQSIGKEEKKNENDSCSLVAKSHEEEQMGGSQFGSEEKKVFDVDLKKPNEFVDVVVVGVPENGSQSRAVKIDFVESVKSSSSSSDSSSDEESHQLVEKEKDPEPLETTDDGSRKLEAVESIGEVVVAAQEERNHGPDDQVVCSHQDVVQVVEKSSVIDDLPSKDSEEKTLVAPVDGQGIEVSNNGGEHPKDESETVEHRKDESETLRSVDNHVHGLESAQTATESGALGSSDNQQQQQVAVIPPPVQPTSWKSCCGLFDVLMGSSR